MSQPGPDRKHAPDHRHRPHPLPTRPLPQNPPPAPTNGFGIAALVLAVIGLVFELVPLTGFISFMSGAIGIVFGVLGVVRDGKALANLWVSGLGAALSLTALVLGIWGMALTSQSAHAPADDLDSGLRHR
jgi:hypothetical protein